MGEDTGGGGLVVVSGAERIAGGRSQPQTDEEFQGFADFLLGPSGSLAADSTSHGFGRKAEGRPGGEVGQAIVTTFFLRGHAG
jgi:hypothetical protein